MSNTRTLILSALVAAVAVASHASAQTAAKNIGALDLSGSGIAVPASSPRAVEPPVISGGGGFGISCGSANGSTWNTTSSNLQVIEQCVLSAPTAGFIFISADASLALSAPAGPDYEANFELGLDDPTGDIATDRWVNVYTNANDGTDKSVAISILKPVAAGIHTVYFLGRRYTGTGTVTVYDPAISAYFVSTGLACGVSGNATWTTTSATLAPIVQCTVTAPADGFLFIAADSSVAFSGSASEALFRLGLDDPTGDIATDRWVNIYPDTGDGTDEIAAVKILKPVTAGNHIVSFLGKRYTGTGTVQVYDPSLTAIFVPSTQACGASGNTTFTTASSAFVVVRQCTLTAPADGWMYVTADASAGLFDTAYEGLLRIGIDVPFGDTTSDRWLDVTTDAGDGTDRSVAVSFLKHVTAGPHTINFVASRFGTGGTLLLYDPTLTAEFIGAAPPVLQSTVSRKAHGSAGTFDLPLAP